HSSLSDKEQIMNSWVNFSAIWKIVVFGLIAGAGLASLVALGMVSLAKGPKTQTAGADSDVVVAGNTVNTAISGLCFLIVLAAIGWGINEIYKIGHPAPTPAK